jgi:hypothetical protein
MKSYTDAEVDRMLVARWGDGYLAGSGRWWDGFLAGLFIGAVAGAAVLEISLSVL